MTKRRKNKGYLKNRSKNTNKNRGQHVKRDKDFSSTDINTDISKEGIKMERESMRWHSIVYGIVIILGAAFTFLDIRDKGMLFEGIGFNFSATMVGVLIIIVGVVAMMRNKPHVTIANKE